MTAVTSACGYDGSDQCKCNCNNATSACQCDDTVVNTLLKASTETGSGYNTCDHNACMGVTITVMTHRSTCCLAMQQQSKPAVRGSDCIVPAINMSIGTVSTSFAPP